MKVRSERVKHEQAGANFAHFFPQYREVAGHFKPAFEPVDNDEMHTL
jgi:hypothetical protein